MKRRTPSVVAGPRGGGAAFGGNRAHAAGSTDAASALAAPYRASAAPGVVPAGSLVALASTTYRRAIFSDFQLTAAINSAIPFPAIVCVTAHPTLKEWKVNCRGTKPACPRCSLKRCHGFCGQGSSKTFRCAISRGWHFGEKVTLGHIPSA